MRVLSVSAVLLSVALGVAEAAESRPNILFVIADDWSWPHASIYGAAEVDTPAFDRVAREGILFHNAFAAAPQCSPNRAAILSGRAIWQLAEAGTHASIFPNTYAVFTQLLATAGYDVGYTGKGWGPGDFARGGWDRNPAGAEFNARTMSPPADGMADTNYAANFFHFLEECPGNAPFCFWFGAKEPHRRYEAGSGEKAGKQPSKVEVPAFLPDSPPMRSDILDYYVEIEWFDEHLGRILDRLEAIGELDNTLVVVTSDNGMPFPRAKANVYEFGVHMPLAVRWPAQVAPGRESHDLIEAIDFAPTFLDVAGVDVPETIEGRSFAGLLRGDSTYEARDHVLFGRERHTHARYDNLGYPCRAIRSRSHLLIWNVKPERWPAGDPARYHDIDESPAKDLVLGNEDHFFDAAVGKRPEWELYDVNADPACMENRIDEPSDAETAEKLRNTLLSTLQAQGDPRAVGHRDVFESYPRVSGMRPELGGFAERGAYNPKYVN